MRERRTFTFPTAASDDGQVVAIGFPDDRPIPTSARTCGDGVHVFTPLVWRTLDDAVCLCGNIEPGWPVMARVYGRCCPERIVIPDPDVAIIHVTTETITDD